MDAFFIEVIFRAELALNHHIHRIAGMGARMMINGPCIVGGCSQVRTSRFGTKLPFANLHFGLSYASRVGYQVLDFNH
jgi:hypothetical protein